MSRSERSGIHEKLSPSPLTSSLGSPRIWASLCLLGPAARDDVIGLAIGGEVHEHRREEQRGAAALQEEHLKVVVGMDSKLAQIGLGLGDDLREGRQNDDSSP